MFTSMFFRRFTTLLLIQLFIFSSLAPLAASPNPARTIKNSVKSQEKVNAPQREGELLVRFRAGVTRSEKDLLIATHGARKTKDLTGQSNVEQLQLPAGRDAKSVAAQMLLSGQVDFAEPNFLIAKDDVIPNDAKFSEQWALRNVGQNGGQFGSDVNAIAAWKTATGAKSTVVAVIDSGIDFSHPDLINNQWFNPIPGANGDLFGWDFVTNSAEIVDEQGHGTAVAGIIAAEGNNSVGTAGVMWRASLMSLRVLDNTGTGDVADALEAIDYAIAHGAQVINLSWGTSGESLALRDALERAVRSNVVVVCSAGNGGRDLAVNPYYPASFKLQGLISVAGTDNFDRLASWSNWEAKNVTVAAPGVDILTTQMGGGYWNVSGTSAAAPLVSGIVGLLRTNTPGASALAIDRALAQGARKTASLSGKVTSGGVADAAGALQRLHGNQSPRLSPPGLGTGGKGPGGSFSTTPPETATGAPGSQLPNLDELRKATSEIPKAKAPIESNLICADCDPLNGGGGGSNYPANDPNFSAARRRPINETGRSGAHLGSRNFNWALPLVHLPGRAGLDVNLRLAYNSLVWTKDGSYMKFNADLGSPAPGFRLGLPVLQRRFLNPQTGIYAYMLVTPEGSRVELRQVGSTNIYESQDSNYAQLDVTNPSAPFLRTTNGTRFTFTSVTINSEFRCTQIKDRNGNYISATYNSTNGHLLTLTDTANRIVTFVYDANNNLQAIRQTWNGAAHDWATFTYGEVFVAPAFGGGLAINGPNNINTTVLTQVNLHDGRYFTFQYNAAFAQVNRINQYAADGHLLSYTSYNVSSAAGQTECPRFTEQRDWAENWNSGNEAVTTYSVAADNSWGQATAPDGTIEKNFFAITGWQSGLVTLSEIWSGGVKKKWTTIAWTQDDTNLTYQKNPRITETNVYDAEGNRRRVGFTYYPTGSFSLPMATYEYAADAVTLLRRVHTNYQLSPAYTDRRIIGLPTGKYVFDGNDNLYQFDIFDYDYGGGALVNTPAPAVQHDAAGYGLSFLTGRGNLSLVRRVDVNNNNNWTNITFAYNINGSPTASTDSLWRNANISYTDSFSDGVNRNTFAYPTTFGDADGFQNLAKYNYDFGAITWTQSPSPNVGQAAPTQTMTYDSAARLQQITNVVTGAYMRKVYPINSNSVQIFSTVVAGAGESYAIELFDGAGRLRGTATDHPGSTGLYSGQYMVYNNMGQLTQQSNPTEMNASWTPAGDDSAWVYTLQAFDWQGRPTVTTLPDGSTRENTYGNCGCAGGDVTTIRDERGRRRKVTQDVLGRLKQVDELHWNQTVYATTTYTYDTADRLTQINQGGQIRSFAYDGIGRLQTRTTPEQGTTTYSYYADSALQTITDARGATTSLSYNNRGLVTGVTFGVPGGVAATPNLTFGYDAAGNRTSMTDGLGSVSYVYDQLSRLTSETRTFTGVAGSFGLSYGYNLGNELTSITDPWGTQVSYNYDKSGRPTSISGSGYGGVTSYVSSMSYRAFGLKQMNYSNGRTLSLGYDNRLRITSWSIPGVLRMQYLFEGGNGSKVGFARNQDDETLDRFYGFDHVGRLTVARTGNEARIEIGEQVPVLGNGPYSHTNTHDQWGNITARSGWGGDNPAFTATYVNNKRPGATYDAAGNLTADGGITYTYDATGQQATANFTGYSLQQYYDGNGLRAKKIENSVVTLYLRSTVLGGQIVAEMNSTGAHQRGYVYLGSQLIAVQQSNAVSWVHQDPFVKAKRVTNGSGTVVSTVELDPWGGHTNRSSNDNFQPQKFTTYTRDGIAVDDAMFRRYNRWFARFEQPDPADGSYELTDPQTFNRYAYVSNDPVNFTDPDGLCRFIIALTDNANLTPEQLNAVQSRISAVFSAAAHQVTFVPGNTTSADYRLSIWTNPAAAGRQNIDPATAVGSTTVNMTTRRVTNEGRVYVERLVASATRDTVSRILFNASPRFLGYGLGTAGAHEIGHFLLQQNWDNPGIRGIMTARFGGLQWFGAVRTFNGRQLVMLNQLCEPARTNTTLPRNSITIRPIQPLMRLGLGGVNIYTPAWMRDFLDWVNSIGRDPEVIVTACVGGNCPRQ